MIKCLPSELYPGDRGRGSDSLAHRRKLRCALSLWLYATRGPPNFWWPEIGRQGPEMVTWLETLPTFDKYHYITPEIDKWIKEEIESHDGETYLWFAFLVHNILANWKRKQLLFINIQYYFSIVGHPLVKFAQKRKVALPKYCYNLRSHHRNKISSK